MIQVAANSIGTLARSGGIYLICSLFSATTLAGSPHCSLLLHNANIVSMNADNEKHTMVGIGNGRILAVSKGDRKGLQCDREIDLHGRTVIPGLIDTHIHFLRDGVFPGYDVRAIETTSSIAELQSAFAAAANSFLIAKGGFNHRQFAEDRMPTAAELDNAVPDHPVYIQEGFRGLGSANTLAMDFFRAGGIRFPADGVISSRLFGDVEEVLRAAQTKADKLRETQRLMEQAGRWGLTTIVDQGDAPGGYDANTHYDSVVELWRRGQMPIRVRLSLLSYDTADSNLLEQRLRNNFMGFGDDKLKVVGVGEHIITYPGLFYAAPPDGGELLARKMRHIAEKGWTYTQHSSSLEQNRSHIAIMARLNKQIPLANLHWSLAQPCQQHR